jgi:Ca2+-binding RTX toxin-like protein
MSRSPKWAAAAIGLAAFVPLALPAAANAAFTETVQGNKLTVTDNPGSADAIVLTAPAGTILINGQPSTPPLPAGNEAEIVVNGGDEADSLDAGALAATNYKSLEFNGGEGNDILLGGQSLALPGDHLNGDGGNDRITGFKGPDVVVGGTGDDVMIWNNGDGNDSNDGGEGNDESVFNGSTGAVGDEITVTPEAPAGRVLLKRTVPTVIEIDILAERVTFNGLEGNDKAAGAADLASRTTLTLNGGIGNDELAGGDGADTINGEAGEDKLSGGAGADTISGAAGNDEVRAGDGGDQVSGGEENDVLAGEGGDDRLLGDKGADTANGGEGDDVIVWNNGDGTDKISGGTGFDRAEQNGSAGAVGDQFKLVPSGTTATFERTNLVPFKVEFVPAVAGEANAGIELDAVNGGIGDDTFAVSPGLKGLVVAADGGPGNDVLSGAEEPDSLLGGGGNDMLNPGAGNDLVEGQDGNDQILARDNAADVIRGGAGTDSAQTDGITVDSVEGVENLDATAIPAKPSPDTKALLPKLGKVKVTHSGAKLLVRVPLSCPAAETGGCRTTVTLETAKAVNLGAVRAVLVLGSTTVNLAAGHSATATIRLSAGVSALARSGKVAARILLASSDAAGNSASHSVAAGLRIPRS